MKVLLPVLLPILLVAGCRQSNAGPIDDRAGHRDLPKLLARMQAVDANPDPMQRCLDYPSPPGVTWTTDVIAARCELLAPQPAFLGEGLAKSATGEAGAIWNAGFRALLADPQASPATRDGRLSRALDFFGSAAALPYAEKWLASDPQSAFAHAAKGASLLARAARMRGTKYAADTAPEDLDNTAKLAEAAARELQMAYLLDPRLSIACALRTRALNFAPGSESALEQGRICAHAHPESYVAAMEWSGAAEPRWGGSKAAQAEVMAFLDRNASRNPLLASVVGKIMAYDILASGEVTTRQEIEQLQRYVSYGPNAGTLNSISVAWEELGETDLSMAYLSSAVRFDFGSGDRHRFMRASLNSVARPEWAVIDYRILNETYKGDPSIAIHLAQAEENARNGTGRTFAREGSVTFEGDPLGKATLLSECLRMGTSDRVPDREMRDCSDHLVVEWPDDPAAWYVHAIVLKHNGKPAWKEAAQRYLVMADASSNENSQRIELIRELLKAAGNPASAGSGQP